MKKPYLPLLLSILVIKAFVLVFLILNGTIGLSPDEAQYWTWSQQLDWGYYSKPPGIAWQIWLSTKLFGNTLLGVRSGSIFLGFLLPLIIYLIAKWGQLKTETAFWAALTFALTPLGIMGSFLAITDVGMIVFWALGCALIIRALSQKQTPNYSLLGVCILLGALYKWPIYLLWSFVIGLTPIFPHLKSKKIVVGILISLLGLLPSLFWNSTHDWVTIRHVTQSIEGSDLANHGQENTYHGNPLEFIGAQIALVSPLVFLFLFAAIANFFGKRKEEKSPALLFIGLSWFSLLIIFIGLSLFKKVQGNWCDFIYPTAFAFYAWYLCETDSWNRIWLKINLVVSVILISFGLAIPYIQSHGILSSLQLPYKLNPFRHNVGWNNLEKALQEAKYKPGEHFLFASGYQMTSILSFYGEEQKRAYFLNLHGIRNNQFSYWPSMADEQKGKTGFYVRSENAPHLKKHMANTEQEIQSLLPYFDEVEFVGTYPLFDAYGEMVKGALIFRCVGYNGKIPAESHRF